MLRLEILADLCEGDTVPSLVLLAHSRLARTSNMKPLCFVLMPFNEKPVPGGVIDFNAVYADLIAPAIAQAKGAPQALAWNIGTIGSTTACADRPKQSGATSA